MSTFEVHDIGKVKLIVYNFKIGNLSMSVVDKRIKKIENVLNKRLGGAGLHNDEYVLITVASK